jgi:hypothetical protein
MSLYFEGLLQEDERKVWRHVPRVTPELWRLKLVWVYFGCRFVQVQWRHVQQHLYCHRPSVEIMQPSVQVCGVRTFRFSLAFILIEYFCVQIWSFHGDRMWRGLVFLACQLI